MGDGIYVALSGAIAQTTSLDATAANLANASTEGYQRILPVFREQLSRAMNAQTTADPNMRYTSVASTRIDTTRGTVRSTGRSLDVALPEGTFLAVTTPRGERYTRSGSLTVASDGTLKTSHGDVVSGEDGKPIKLAQTDDIRIDPTGAISLNGETQGRVRLVNFQDPGLLTHEGGTLLATSPGAGPPQQSNAALEVGSIEESNVSVVGSMSDLITTSRTFEAFQRVIDTFRDEDQKAATVVPGDQQ